MDLNQIGAPIGANRKTKRRGRGSGSGHGKNACRGRKGAKKRSGRTTRPGFEGGQMQLVRRLPKRGFNAPFKNDYQVVNVESLNRFRENSFIGAAELKSAGLIGSVNEPVKILGGGELKKAVTVKADRISGSAKKKFETAGAKFEPVKPIPVVIAPPAPKKTPVKETAPKPAAKKEPPPKQGK